MELYTSLVRLKQSINGAEPPMTPLSVKAKHVLDPSATDGMGSLREDEEKGLLCPVKDCGVWLHRMKRHMDKHHPEIGGAAGIKDLLEIPRSVRLVSKKVHKRTSDAMKYQWEHASPEQIQSWRAAARRGLKKAHSEAAIAKRPIVRATTKLAGARNLRKRCEAQMRQDFLDVRMKLGRQPSRKEAIKMLGHGYVDNVRRVYGSWSAAISQFGFEPIKKTRHFRRPTGVPIPREAVMESLLAYYKQHGELPNSAHADAPKHEPIIPSRKVVTNAFGCHSWEEAMRRAAALLNIHGGRYGLPEKTASVA